MPFDAHLRTHAALIERCEAITRGEAASQSYAVLIEEPNDLCYARAGGHYLVFLEHADEIILVDILHTRSDLAHHVAALSSLQGGET